MDLAIFDFDWTLVKPKEGRTYPINENDWQWFRKSVSNVIKEYSKTHKIVIRSDQSKK
jgi:histidinol phosphatase-like enzyme